MHSVTSAQFQVDLWIKNKDIYSDEMYWRNEVNGNITFDRPGVHHYLPPNFQIPIPPLDLPADVPLETSSSEDSEEEGWIQKYEAKRRKKREEQVLLELALNAKEEEKKKTQEESESSSDSSVEANSAADGESNSEQRAREKRYREEALRGNRNVNSDAVNENENGSVVVASGPPAEVNKEELSVRSGVSGNSGSSGASGSSGSSGSSSGSGSGSNSKGSHDGSSTSASKRKTTGNSKSEVALTTIDNSVNDDNGSEMYWDEPSQLWVATTSSQQQSQLLSPQEQEAQQEQQKWYWDEALQQWTPATQAQEQQGVQLWLWDVVQQQWLPADNTPQQQQLTWDESTIQQQQLQLSGDTMQTQTQAEGLFEVALQNAGDTASVDGTNSAESKSSGKLGHGKYTFRKLMDKYNYRFDENEEQYVGIMNSMASVKLQSAIELAREYMQNNKLYLSRNKSNNDMKAAAGSSKSNKTTLRLDQDARTTSHQVIDLFAKPSNLGKGHSCMNG